MTNFEKIRQMNDEELFQFLLAWEDTDIDYTRGFCDLCQADAKEKGEKRDCDEYCTRYWLNSDSSEYNGLDAWEKYMRERGHLK